MKENLPKAILFDLDDTILALSESAEPCWRKVCQEFAPRLPSMTAEGLFEAIRASGSLYWQDAERHRRGRLNLPWARREVVAKAFAQAGIEISEQTSLLAIEIADAFTFAREAALWPLPGALETLRWLRQQGIWMGLITNGAGPAQREKIERFGLDPLFDLILIEGEFGVGKPDERVFLHALQSLGVAAGETWMVGDKLEWDILPCQRLGIYTVWVDAAGKGLPADNNAWPDRVVRSIAELVSSRFD
jgi:putative hydrolase of the HAD superfamily